MGVPRSSGRYRWRRPPRPPRLRSHRRDAGRRPRSGLQGEAGAAPLPRIDGQAHARAVRARRRGEYGGDAGEIWTGTKRPARAVRSDPSFLPGYGDEKAKIFLAILGKRLQVALSGWPRSTRVRSPTRTRFQVAEHRLAREPSSAASAPGSRPRRPPRSRSREQLDADEARRRRRPRPRPPDPRARNSTTPTRISATTKRNSTAPTPGWSHTTSATTASPAITSSSNRLCAPTNSSNAFGWYPRSPALLRAPLIPCPPAGERPPSPAPTARQSTRPARR